MAQRLETATQKVLFALCALAAGFSIVSIVLKKANPSGLLFVAAAVFAVLIFFLFRFFAKHEVGLKKVFPFVLAALAVWFMTTQILLGMLMEMKPVCDFGQVFDGACDWVEQGTFAIDWNREYYFYIYPHQLGLTGVLTGLFSIVNLLGGDNYYQWAVVLASAMTTATLLLSVDILRRTAGIAAAFIGAVVCFLLPMFYLSSAAFYTDVMSFLFPILFLWLWMIGKDKPFKKRIGLDILMAVVAFIGFEIKATVVIMPVAVFLCDLLTRRWRTLLVQIPLLLVVFVVGSLLWNNYLFGNYLDKDLSAEYKYPITDWLAMGDRTDDAEWVLEDAFTVEPDFNVRNQMAIDTWKQYFQKLRDQGKIFDFYTSKMAQMVGAGTLGIEDFLDDFPWNDNALQNIVFYDGDWYPTYDGICSGIMLALWCFAFVGAVSALWRKSGGAWACPQVYTALLGIFIFLLAWEKSIRYFSNYYAVLLIAGIIGLAQTNDLLRKRRA